MIRVKLMRRFAVVLCALQEVALRFKLVLPSRIQEMFTLSSLIAFLRRENILVLTLKPGTNDEYMCSL